MTLKPDAPKTNLYLEPIASIKPVLLNKVLHATSLYDCILVGRADIRRQVLLFAGCLGSWRC